MFLNHFQGELNQSRLVILLNIDKSNVTRVCEIMEDKGWIKRFKSENDKRCHQVFLTKKGKNLANKLEHSSNEFLQLILDQIPEQKHDELINLLELINQTAFHYKMSKHTK